MNVTGQSYENGSSVGRVRVQPCLMHEAGTFTDEREHGGSRDLGWDI
jgi:hypothetical protein